MVRKGLVFVVAVAFSTIASAVQAFPGTLSEMDEYIESIFLGEPITSLDQLLALDDVRKVHRGTYERYLVKSGERDYLDSFSLYVLRADGLEIEVNVSEDGRPAFELSDITITSPDWVLSNGIKVGDMIDELSIPGTDIRGTRWACGNLHCVLFTTRFGEISEIKIQMRLGGEQVEAVQHPNGFIDMVRVDQDGRGAGNLSGFGLITALKEGNKTVIYIISAIAGLLTLALIWGLLHRRQG